MSNTSNLDDKGAPKPAITTNNLSENANLSSFLDNGSNTPVSSVPDGLKSVNTIQSLIGGNSYVGPNPIDRGYSTPEVRAFSKGQALRDKIENFKDPLMKSRATSFDGSRFGYNFDRYYHHPKFKTLGFNVYRDNETLYNERSTWADDWSRMSSQWLGLAGQAFSGVYKGWGRFGQATDDREAALMENSLSIAQSSKEGMGAWFTNFAANSAYTMGIVGSVLLEEAALAGITYLSGGATSGVAAAETAINATRLGGAISKLVRSMRGIGEAKTLWQSLGKLATGGIKAGADFINPLRNTTNLISGSLKTEKTLNRINEFAKVKKTFGAFYRDMREINLVLSESRLEGGFAKNKVINEATKEFVDKYGRMPNERETKDIYDRAQKAGMKTTLQNIPAIYFSNRIVFDTMFKGFKPINRLLSGEVGKNPFFKLVKNWDWKKGAAGTPFSLGEVGFKFSDLSLKSLKGTFSRLSKEGLPSLTGKLFRYTNANLMEGLQESFQEVVQGANTDYYLTDYYAKLHKDPFLAAKNSMSAAFGKSLAGQFTTEGLNTFLSGFLMGGGVQPIQNLVIGKGGLMAQRIFDSKEYEKAKENYKKNIQSQVDALNAVYTDPKKFASWLDQNVKLQKDLSAEYEEAEESGDAKEAKDSRQDSMFHHVHTLLQTDKYDYFMEALSDLKQLDTKDLADAFADLPKGRGRKKQLHERLDSAISKAEFIREKYDFLQEEYPNPFDPSLIDPKKSPDLYFAELRAHESFEEAKKHALFSEYSFNQASKRMDSLISKAIENNPLGKSSAVDISAIYSAPVTVSLLKTLDTEIAALSEGTPEQKAEAKKKQRTYEHLKNLHNLRVNYLRVNFLIDKAAAGNQEAIDELNAELESLDTKKLVIYDDEGNKINFKSAKVPVDVKLEAYYKDSLKSAYMAYLKNIAKTQNVYPVLEAINESFQDFIDFTKLSSDVKRHSDNVNILANPLSLLNLAGRINNAKKLADENREKYQEEALETYANYAKNNSLMQELLDIGVYFDPESFEEFANNDVLPETFIDAHTNSIITPEDPRYQKVIDIIEKYEKTTGKTFSGKPVTPKETKVETPPTTQAPPPEDEEKKKATTPPPATRTTAGTSGIDLSTLPVDVKEKLMAEFAKAQAESGVTDFEMWVQESPKAQAILKAAAPPKRTPPPPKKSKKDVEMITEDNPRSLDGPDAVTAPIYSNPAVLNADEKGYSVTNKSGNIEKAKRVSDLKKKEIPTEVKNSPKFRFSQERGNVLDSSIRFFAKPDRSTKLSLKDDIINAINNDDEALATSALMDFLEVSASGIASRKHSDTKKPYTLELTKGFQKQFADALKELALVLENYTWNTNLPSLHGILLNERYAGSVDILLELDGEYYILDIKSSETSRRAQPDIYTDDIIQLNAYADLFEQMTGKPIKGLMVANLVVTSVNDGQTLTKAYWDTYEKDGKDNILIDIPRKSIAEQFPEEAGKPETPPKPPVPPAPAAPAAPAATVDQAELTRRKKLSGWDASYELAKIAKTEGVDLSKLTREEYANYAIKNGLKIDDSQLRSNPKHRNATKPQEVGEMMKADRASLSDSTKKAFDSFYRAMMAIVNKPQAERYLAQNVRLYSNTKDSNSWLYFGINNGTNTNESFTHKSYFSLKNLNDFSPEVFRDFMVELQKRGYNGDVKIFQDLEVQGPALSDQVVMHGYSEADAKLALEVAKEFYGDKILESSYGKDEVINGKNMSYSQILSDKIKERVDSGNTQPLETTTTSAPTPATPAAAPASDIERRRQEEFKKQGFTLSPESSATEGPYRIEIDKSGEAIISNEEDYPEGIGLKEWLAAQGITKFEEGLSSWKRELAYIQFDVINKINAEYDAELAALEGKPAQQQSSVKPTIDLSREWRNDLESRPVYTSEGVNTMRTSDANAFENFGNPFSEAGYGGTIKVPSIGAAVIAYKEWLLGTNHKDVKPQQREWILNQINQGKLDGATLLYAGKSESRGQGMHPTALAEVVEQLRGTQPQATVSAASQPAAAPKAKRKNKILSKYKGKIIYVGPGIGKDNLVETMEFVIDMNDLVIEEINKRYPDLVRGENESKSDFIYRASEKGEKDFINRDALSNASKLLKKGYTILTSSTKFIKNADILFTSEPGNAQAIQEIGEKNIKGFQETERTFAKAASKTLIQTNNIESALTEDKFISEKPAATKAQKPAETKVSKESPTLKVFREISDPIALIEGIQAYAAMDDETRESLYYILDTDGKPLPLSQEEFTNMAKQKIEELIKDNDVSNYAVGLLTELESPFLDTEPSKIISAEEKDNISDEVNKGQTITDANQKDSELLNEVKKQSRAQIKDEFLKGIGCTPKI